MGQVARTTPTAVVRRGNPFPSPPSIGITEQHARGRDEYEAARKVLGDRLHRRGKRSRQDLIDMADRDDLERVRHGLWDFDLPSAPILFDSFLPIPRSGPRATSRAQRGKQRTGKRQQRESVRCAAILA